MSTERDEVLSKHPDAHFAPDGTVYLNGDERDLRRTNLHIMGEDRPVPDGHPTPIDTSKFEV